MTKHEREQSLTNARSACRFLELYIESQIVDGRIRADIACLIQEFGRLDAIAQRLRAGGRPRIKTDNPKTLAQRRWRDKQR